MPDYEITDPRSGKTLVLTGDSPPTEAELEQVFAQFAPKAPETPTAQTPTNPLSTMGDVAIGAVKGVGNTLVGMGEAAYNYVPGVAAASDAIWNTVFPDTKADGGASFAAMRPAPSNTAQKVGYTAEQIGEFFTPVGAAGKVAKAAEVGKSGLLTLAQSGSPTTAGVSAGITAALPGAAKVAGKVAGRLGESAQKSMSQALGATKEWAKSDAAKLAPEMLRRGVKGTRASMLAQAEQGSRQAGQRLGALYAQAGAQGQTISGLAIRGELELAKEALMVPGKTGALVPVPMTERVLKSLDKLTDGLEKMGDDVPVHHAAAIKTAWDRIVAKAGLYGPKAASNATDNAEAWAVREGTGALRTALHSANPDIATLSKEYAFWKGLKNVLKATELRTQAQSGGLQAAMGASIGAGPGLVAGDWSDAFVGAAAGRQFVKLVQSPYWRTAVSGPLKDKLAKALATGSPGQATSVWGRIVAALPSQAQQAIAR